MSSNDKKPGQPAPEAGRPAAAATPAAPEAARAAVPVGPGDAIPGRETVNGGRRKAIVAIGAGVVGAAVGVPLAMAVRSCVPNVLYETPRRFKAGKPDGLADGATFFAEQRVFVFKRGRAYHCLSAVCTHLGCTVQLLKTGGGENDFELHCPCHGSKYHADGVNYAGPAPKPLAHHAVSISPDDGQIVVDIAETAAPDWRLEV